MNRPSERLPRLRREAHFGRVFTCFAERPAQLNALFAQTLSRHAADEALVCEERRISYAELDGIAARVAAGLARDGVRAGDRIAILCANEPEFVYALLAAFRLGAIAVPINVREAKPELAYVLNQCKARALVFDADLAERIPSSGDVPQLELRYAVGEAMQDIAAPGRPFAQLLETDAESPIPAATG